MTEPGDRRSVKAPAKLNLALAIVGRRQDGYHDLHSVFVRVNLADRLSGRLAEGLAEDTLEIRGAPELKPADNSVLHALEMLREEIPIALRTLELALEKRVPIGAGLGGGSADAAAGLALASALWGLRLPAAERLRLAARIGADVPFFAAAHDVAEVAGIGELIDPLPAPGQPGFLLVTPSFEISTASAFIAYDQSPVTHASAAPVVEDLVAALRAGLTPDDLVDWAPRLREANDLWPAASGLEPAFSEVRSDLELALDRPFLLSGSGSSLFALYPSPEAAVAARERLLAADLPTLRSARLVEAVGIAQHEPEGVSA